MEDMSAITMEEIDLLPNNAELIKTVLRAVLVKRDMLEQELDRINDILDGSYEVTPLGDDVVPFDVVHIEEALDVEEDDGLTSGLVDVQAQRKARIAELMKQNREAASE